MAGSSQALTPWAPDSLEVSSGFCRVEEGSWKVLPVLHLALL